MLDPKKIREATEQVQLKLTQKNSDIQISHWIALDTKRREKINELDKLKADRNKSSEAVASLKKQGQNTDEIIAQTRELSQTIKLGEESLVALEDEIQNLSLFIPNLPHDSVPVGKNATENVVRREWGTLPAYDFPLKDHLEIGEALGLFDFKRGAKISGRGFPVYTGRGALLERALIQFFLEEHTLKNGFTEIIPPLLVNRESMVGTSQIPKMEEDMYAVAEDGLFLIPTAEVPLTNLHAGETLIAKELPISYVGYTPCFRREAGSWGKDTRGFQRLHQFNKVEMVKFTTPETSYETLEEMVGYAEGLLQKLGLKYRVLELCTGDLSFGAAKCYDLEVYAPASEKWLEVSSVSNFEDFQARRAGIRFKSEGKPSFVHTLNGSGLATPRILVGLLESFQTSSGSIKIPEALHRYTSGLAEFLPN